MSARQALLRAEQDATATVAAAQAALEAVKAALASLPPEPAETPPVATPAAPVGITDAGAFFASLRTSKALGTKLTQAQVEGCEAILKVCAGLPLSHVAYALATAAWETARTMQPIAEYGKGRGRKYGAPGRNKGQVPYGRGYVQLTWDENYERADRELGLNGALIADYELALKPDIAGQIMRRGMVEGWFTGRKFAHTLPAKGPAAREAFVSSRPIINGRDKAAEIADLAMAFQQACQAGGWGEPA